MKPGDIARYLFLAIVWGLSFLVVVKIVEAFGWVGAVTFRALIAAGSLYLLARLFRRKLDFSAGWRPFAIVGATTVAGQLIGLSYAAPRIGTAMAAIFVAAIPLFSMIISQLWGLERTTRQGFAGLVLGISGIVLLVGFPAVPVTFEFALGCVASILAALCAAFGSNYASRHLRNSGNWETTIGAFLFGGLMTLPLIFAVPLERTPVAMDYLYLVIAAVLMSVCTYIAYFRLVASIGPTRAISVEFLVTVIAVFIGATVLGEKLSAMQFIGGITIMVGCALVLNLVPAWMRPRPSVPEIP
ncbi:DMT family transporter [Thalassospira tepidiphila]|uniref:DMT family transporter n=1 Tax=Thalassospira tepidiphila TaxID=393657 RepID=UPI00291FCEA0|nr:permease [Thalassospira tepidiphila]